MNAMITDVFFDLDHTLWDFERNSALAFGKLLPAHGVAVPLDEFLKHYVPLNFQYWEKYRREEITQTELRYGRFRDTFNLLNYEVPNELIDLLSDDYIKHLPENNHLFDGTLEILDYLSAKYRLHIITNGFHEVQFRKINNASIGHYFVTVTNSEMAGVKKPNPLIFAYALKQANAKKENCIMIGDCIEADVRGAINYGIDAILFNENSPDASIKHVTRLQDLKKYL
jgi:YjjG family noncanonical pyrimidine nucleotidase